MGVEKVCAHEKSGVVMSIIMGVGMTGRDWCNVVRPGKRRVFEGGN